MSGQRLALVVRSAPWAERSGREALDLALAAVTMDVQLELFFIGDGALQLLAGKQSEAAGLPPGLKAWASLSMLGEARFFMAADSHARLTAKGLELLVPVQALEAPAMAARQEQSPHVLVV